MTDNRLYWIWLQQALEPGGVKTALALSAFASPEAIHRASRAELMRAGFTGALLARLCRKSLDPAARILEDSLKDGAFVLTMGDDAYPDCLRNTYMPPLVLYGKGELPPLDRLPAVAMVGTRKASGYGCRAASSIAAGLAAGGCIVISGGAVGIDGASHRGALAGGGLTIAVQGCGLDVDYPKPNRRLREEILAADGVIVTEYPPGSPPLREHFPVRNRLLAGMAMAVCVVEAPERSGSLITARLARNQGRDVYVVPGEITSGNSSGSNDLIKDGAALITKASEILRDYAPRFPDVLDLRAADAAQAASRGGGTAKVSAAGSKASAAPPAPVKVEPAPVPPAFSPCPAGASPGAALLYQMLTPEPLAAEILAQKAGLAFPAALAGLTELEIAGCARNFPGRQFALRPL